MFSAARTASYCCNAPHCVALNIIENNRIAPDDFLPFAIRSHFASIEFAFVSIFLQILPIFAHVFRDFPTNFPLHFARISFAVFAPISARISPPGSRASTLLQHFSPSFCLQLCRISHTFASNSTEQFARSYWFSSAVLSISLRVFRGCPHFFALMF